jgi:hypothetical protein
MLWALATDVPTAPTERTARPLQASEFVDAFEQSWEGQKTNLARTTMRKLFTHIKSGATGLAPLAFVLLFTNLASAQGPIFTGDASNLSNIIREALKLMAIVLFCLGAVGVAWSIYNKMTGKEWGNQAFGSLLSFAFGTIVAVFWQLAQGRAVGVDTNF